MIWIAVALSVVNIVFAVLSKNVFAALGWANSALFAVGIAAGVYS